MTGAMNNVALLSSTTTLLVLWLLIFSLQGVTCISRFLLSTQEEMGMLLEDKSRLGSMPPNCYNKCNQCNPCISVQIPAFLSQNNQLHTDTGITSSTEVDMQSFRELSNYKPLGWKCRCRQQLYNP